MKAWGFITGDLIRKVIALVFAVTIYYIVTEHLKEEKLVSVPVEIHLTKDLMMPVEEKHSATVRVRGIPRELDKVDAQSISGPLDITSEHRQPDGSYRVRLTGNNFRPQPGVGVKVVAVDSNPYVVVHLQRRISRELPVALRFSGEPPEMYRVSEASCIPARVTVSGPESTVESIKEIATDQIPISDRESGFEYEVSLAPLKDVVIAPDRVMAQIGIERSVITHELPAVPVGIFYDTAQEITAEFSPDTPPTAKVTLSAPAAMLTVFKPDDLRLYVDVSNVSTPGVYKLPVKCHLRRQGVDVRSIVPADFNLSISKAPIKK